MKRRKHSTPEAWNQQINAQCSKCGTVGQTTVTMYQRWLGGWLCGDCQAERNRVEYVSGGNWIKR